MERIVLVHGSVTGGRSSWTSADFVDRAAAAKAASAPRLSPFEAK